MADFNALEALINANIKKNGVQAITGNILNGILRGMVSALGKGYTIAGSVTPSSDPGTMTGPVAYIAYTAGTYTHFDGLEVEQGEVAMLIYNEAEWHKEVLYSLAATATVDGNVGTPEVGVSFVDGLLTFDFRNMKGEPGVNGQDGEAAGFGAVTASVDASVGTPSVTVSSSGPNTAKSFAFSFHNLKGEQGVQGPVGVESCIVTVDNTSGTPSCSVSLVGQVLHLDFTGLKGAQGDTGSSVDYPFTIVNNLTTNDAAQALSAAMGVQLESEVSQLEAELYGIPKEDIDLSNYPSTLGIINGANGKWWVPSSDNYHKAIPVSPGETYTIVANNDYAAVYALLKSYSIPTEGSTPDYCDGETNQRTITKGTSGTVTIPADCTYIVVIVEMSTQNRTPSSFSRSAIEGEIPSLQNQIDNINDSLAVRETTDLTGELLPGYIATNGEVGTVVDTTVVSNTGFLHKIVSVEKGDVATIKGLGAGAPRLWCFTDRNYKILSHAEAATSISVDTPFVADSDGYFIFNTYNNVSYGLSLTAKSGETYTDKIVELEQEVVGKLDKSVVELSQSVEFASGYFLSSGALNPAPINTSIRRYTTNLIGGGFTITLKQDWFLRSLNKYDKYGNFLENIEYGSSYTGKVTIQDEGNSHYFQFDAQYTGGSYPTTVISPITSISFAKTKVDAGANLVEIHPQKFGELDLSFDLKNVAPDYPAQPRINGLSNLLALWDDIVANYGGTKENAGTEAGLTAPEYMADAQPIYVYKFLSNQARNDQSKHIKVLIYAGEHINEYLGHNILLEFMRQICEEWATDHNCELLRSMVDWYVLPCINPYGYDFKNDRTNYNGVNINRNFAASNWKSGEVGENYGGPSAASEYETKVVQYYVETINPDIVMDVHTGGTNAYGSLGSLEMSVDDLTYNKMDFYKLASTICRTASNLFVMGNTNYPQNLVTPLLDTNVQLKSAILALGTSNAYTGLSHQYAMEKGVKLALLIELNQFSNWVNGVYSSSTVGDQADTSAKLARANLLFLINTMYRAVKAISQNIE